MGNDLKKWIDNASLYDLLYRWRFSKIGDSVFSGEMGDYYSKKMKEKREDAGPEEWTRISKLVGWEN